jgi:spore coat protein U-like protein
VSRSTTAYASATRRERVHALEFYVGEVSPVSVDFTSILGATAALSSALWEIDNGAVGVMASAVIDGNTSSIQLTANAPGNAVLRCTGGTDDGARFVQMFALQVDAAQAFAIGNTTGPQSLQATAAVTPPVTTGGGGQVFDGGGA